MVQFLSIIFFFYFFNFCWGFQKFPFLCHPVFEVWDNCNTRSFILSALHQILSGWPYRARKRQRTEHTKEKMDMHIQFLRKAPNLERLNENKNINLKFTLRSRMDWIFLIQNEYQRRPVHKKWVFVLREMVGMSWLRRC